MGNPVDTLVNDHLLGGTNILPVSQPVTLVSGAGALKRGTVLGIITASGKATIVNSGNSDGSQTPDSILAQDTDSTSGDVATEKYDTGEYNADALVFGGSDTVATHQAALRLKNIHIKTSIPA